MYAATVTTAPSATATDPLASLPAATVDAVRAELRAGERVIYAAAPVPMPYAQFTPSVAAQRRIELAAGTLGLVCVVVAAVMLATAGFDSSYVIPILIGFGPAIGGIVEWLRIRRVRRDAAHSACVVTNQRTMLLEASPGRAVRAVEARDITEVYARSTSAARGEVRFRIGRGAHDEPSCWHVPNPRACEAAMTALRDSSRSAAAPQTAG